MQIELRDLKERLAPIGQAAEAAGRGSAAGGAEPKSAEDARAFRTVHLNGFTSNAQPRVSNCLNNRKYTLLNFVPTVLYHQFRYFFNLFFLLLCVSQFVPAFKVGLLFSYVSPLVFVLALTMLKEAYDDFRRFQRDKDTNGQLYAVWRKGEFASVCAADLKVGSVLELHANQRIPADCVLLWTSDPSETVFIKTDQLDGETDWKLRLPVQLTQRALAKQPKGLDRVGGYLRCEAPSKEIYDFKGVFVNEGNRAQDEPLGLEQTLWASTVLCSARAVAVVVYVGANTRIAMNIAEQKIKVGRMDEELNSLSKLLFFLMLMLAIALQCLSGANGNFVVEVVKYVLLLSSIIPVSLRVNLDFSKIVFTAKINADRDIEAVARNSTIPEELGRICYIFSDKTGTLTQNDMQFKKISGESFKWTADDSRAILRVIAKEVKGVLQERNPRAKGNSVFDAKLTKAKVVKEFAVALAVCHNVTPTEEDGQRILQASSPDEVALVRAAEDLGLQLKSRTQRLIELHWTQLDEEMQFEVLRNFPFTSERKRMGIIVRDLRLNRIVFYLKGADFVMKRRVPENKRGFLMDECDELSREGLRTLVYAAKVMAEEEYAEWSRAWEAASTQLAGREKAQAAALERLEEGLQFLMITGVEDKLQEECAATIEALKAAGIKIWMLTGDKVETVSCVAISAGLKAVGQSFFVLKELTQPAELVAELNRFSAISDKGVLVVDGTTLATALQNCEEFFVKTAAEVDCVVCCRCSPTQKAEVVAAMRRYVGRPTLSIGDGGNDVPMIRTADVGVGIVGKEGKQAALASDFSVTKFKHVKDLLLWHGRNSYKRGAVMAQFVIHRGFIIAVMQVYFMLAFDYVKVPLFNGYLMLGYTTLYTMLPVFALIYDEDVDKATALRFPNLYRGLQKSRELTPKTFLLWLALSVYQAFTIVAVNALLFDSPYLNFVAITFTALIFVQLLNTLTEVTQFNYFILGSVGLSLLVYLVSILVFNEYFGVAQFTPRFFAAAALTGLVCCLPVVLARSLLARLYPSDESKIMKIASYRRKGSLRRLAERYLLCEKEVVNIKEF